MTPCIIKINQLPKFSHFKLAGVIGIAQSACVSTVCVRQRAFMEPNTVEI